MMGRKNYERRHGKQEFPKIMIEKISIAIKTITVKRVIQSKLRAAVILFKSRRTPTDISTESFNRLIGLIRPDGRRGLLVRRRTPSAQTFTHRNTRRW